MDSDTATALFHAGANLVVILPDSAPTLEFGVDLNSWTTGQKFKGLKLIPPGVHFIYYSAVQNQPREGLKFPGANEAVRSGFFHYFDAKEILVREWDPETETLRPIGGAKKGGIDWDQIDRIRANLLSFEPGMGPYPLSPPTSYSTWQHLTSFITKSNLSLLTGPQADDDTLWRTAVTVSSHPSTFSTSTLPKSANLNVTLPPPPELKRSFPLSAQGALRTKWSRDKSWLLHKTLRDTCNNDENLFLATLQLSFLAVLIGQDLDALDYWKTSVALVCSSKECWFSESAKTEDVTADVRVSLSVLEGFIKVLTVQLDQLPTDFFYDILSRESFLADALHSLADNLPMNHESDTQRSQQLQKIHEDFAVLTQTLSQRFGWDIGRNASAEATGEIDEEEEEEGEFAPVVVDL